MQTGSVDLLSVCSSNVRAFTSHDPPHLQLDRERPRAGMSAHGHNSISNCVRAARNGSEEASLFTEREHEPAPLKAKEQLLLQSLRKSATKGPHLQRKAATAKKRAAVAVEDRDFGVAVASRGSGLLPRAAPAPAPAPAATQAQRRDAPVVAKVFASKAERQHAQTAVWAPPQLGAGASSGRI